MRNGSALVLDRDRSSVQRINAMRAEFARLSDAELRATASKTTELLQWIALTATAAARVLGQDMFDVQLRGALALARGSIAEMQTGEGKTLAAVPAISWLARERRRRPRDDRQRLSGAPRRRVDGRHLPLPRALRGARAAGHDARRAARGLRAATSPTPPPTRSASTSCATASRMRPDEQVHRPFHAAVIDEADSILIDEARIPLVIAGGDSATAAWPTSPTRWCAALRTGEHFTIDDRPPQCRADRRGHPRGRSRARVAAISSRAAICRSTRPCRTRCMRTPCCAATSTTSSRTAPSRWWMSSRAGSRRTAAGPPDCIPRSKPRRASRPSRRDMILGQITLQHLVGAVPAGLRHDRHRRHAVARVPQVYGLRGRDDPDQPAGDPRRSSGRGLPDQGGEGAGGGCRRSAGRTRRGSRCWWGPRASRNRSGSARC